MKHKHKYVLVITDRPHFICECGLDLKMKMKVESIELIDYEVETGGKE